MKTIALRFSDNFAPESGTIAAHQECIDRIGYVWYGKLGAPVSNKICSSLMENQENKILLIHSGKSARYWAYIDKVSKEVPELLEIPAYYRNQAGKFKTWFRVICFESADKSVMSRCMVISSGTPLSLASKSSMSPYFIIDYNEDK